MPARRFFAFALTAAALLAPVSTGAVDRAAASFTLKDINGKKFDLAGNLGKDVVVVNFFATWCAPCMAELPTLQALHEKYGNAGLKVIVISIDDPKSAAKVKPLVRENGWKFSVLLDTETKVVSLYNPKKIVPFTAVIDRNGKIVAEHMGFKSENEGAFEAELKALLTPASTDVPAPVPQ